MTLNGLFEPIGKVANEALLDLTHERWTPQLGVLLMLHKPAGLRNEASNAFADGCKTLLDNQINWL